MFSTSGNTQYTYTVDHVSTLATHGNVTTTTLSVSSRDYLLLLIKLELTLNLNLPFPLFVISVYYEKIFRFVLSFSEHI